MFIPQRYIPTSLSKKDKSILRKELNKSRNRYKRKKYYTRKKVKSFTSKVSPHVKRAMKMYKVKSIKADKTLANKTKCKKHILRKIVNKGRGAYFSSGSRPNQTSHSWGRARLASAITGGPSSRIDYHLLKGCNKNSKALKLSKRVKKKYNRKKKRNKL